MKQAISQEALSRASAMRRNGESWGSIARALGIGEERIRRIIEPGFAERRNAGIIEARYTRGVRGEPRVKLTPNEVRAALNGIPEDTRSRSARFFGDPLPGRSALDRRTHTERSIAVSRSGELLADQKRGVFIGDHLKSGRVV